MPINLQNGEPDTTQYAPQGPLSPTIPQETTGANGPQYSALDFWSAQARQMTPGMAMSHNGAEAELGGSLAKAAGLPGYDGPPAAQPRQDGEDGRIPDDMRLFQDKYTGLHTQREIDFRTYELRQKMVDAQVLGASKWSTGTQLALGLIDPLAMLSMAVPIAGETRLASAVRTAAVGAGVSAGDEYLMHLMDPTRDYEAGDLENVGAGTILGAVLGAALHHNVPKAEFERARSNLEADLSTTYPQDVPRGTAQPVDNAASIAADLRAHLEQHGQNLQATAEAHAQEAAALNPADVTARISAAQERLKAAGEAPTREAREAAIVGESERLQQPAEIGERLKTEHGEGLPAVLRERAGKNLDDAEAARQGEVAAAHAELDAALADQAKLEQAAASQAALQHFQAGRPAETVAAKGESIGANSATRGPSGEPIGPKGETNANAADFQGLRSQLQTAAGDGANGQRGSGQPVPRGSARRTARGAQGGAGAKPEPLTVYRGGAPLEPRHFATDGLHGGAGPTAGLGVTFTNDLREAALLGPVSEHHLDIRNPLELRSEELPHFNSAAEATRWRDEQIAKGHDGLVIDSTHAGGAAHYVAFRRDQVLSPERVAGGIEKGAISSAPGVEAHVLEQINQTGRYQEPEARAYAALVADAYAVQGERFGMTAAELFDKFPLRVQGADPTNGFFQSLQRTFYSNALRQVEGLQQPRAPASQWIKTLENMSAKGVKAEELDWMGVKDWLAKKGDENVTRSELAAFMQHNQVRLEEVEHGTPEDEAAPSPQQQEIMDRLHDEGYVVEEDDDTGDPRLLQIHQVNGTAEPVHIPDAPEHVRALMEELRTAPRATTKFEQYTLPGGENYKEHLLTLPGTQDTTRIAELQRVVDHVEAAQDIAIKRVTAARLQFIHALEASGKPLSQLDAANLHGWVHDYQFSESPDLRARAADKLTDLISRHDSGLSNLRDQHGTLRDYLDLTKSAETAQVNVRHAHEEMNEASGRGFRQSHWEEPNVLAHIRTNERVDAAGKRVLHIEEIQSDWHQQGRRSGYQPPAAIAAAKDARVREIDAETGRMAADRDPVTNQMREERRWHELARERDALVGASVNKPPDAPFKKTWPELAMKRMIAYASDKGFDRITWTTGAQQADRYSLSKKLSTVTALHNPDGNVRIIAEDKRGATVYSSNHARDELPDLLGKEVSAKLLDGLGANHPVNKLTGLDLSVGGEGMKGFYDKILPAIAEKLAKKYGGRVGEARVSTAPALPSEEFRAATPEEKAAQGSEEPVHALDISPQMKEAALAGQPLFQTGRGSYNPDTHMMSLGGRADPSTFLHETGHHFLDMLGALTKDADAPLSAREDFQTLLNWFRVKDADTWHELGTEGQRDYHEQFARGFETYLKDGVAPSSRLAAIFAQFRTWLTKVYESIKGLGQEISPEVRAVMDRLVASERDIEAARTQRVNSAIGETMKRVAGDEVLREELRQMALRETGIEQRGGMMIRQELNGGRGNEFDISRTSWIAKSDWWFERPGEHSVEEAQHAVDKALAGERLGARQEALVKFMVEVSDERHANERFAVEAEKIARSRELDDDIGQLEHEPLLEHTGAAIDQAAAVARLRAYDEDALESLASRFADDDKGFLAAVQELLHAHDESAKIARSVPEDQPTNGGYDDGRATGRALGAAGGERRGAESASEPLGHTAQAPGRPRSGDLFGEAPAGAQQLADETRRRDTARNTGQDSLETGDPSDLFSQARQQHDLGDMLAALPPEDRAPFHNRIAALDHPNTPHPLYAAPGDSVAGAGINVTRQGQLNDYGLARGGRTLGRLTGWFAPGSRLLQSPFLSARQLVVKLAETPEVLNMNMPGNGRPRGASTPISAEAKLKRWEGAWGEAHKAADGFYRQYRAKPPAPGEGPRLDRHGFNEATSHAMRRGDQWYIDEVQKNAQMYRKTLFEPLKTEAQKLGLLPPQEDMLRGTAESYMMRQYDRSKIAADPKAWHQLLADGFREQGVPQEELDDLAHRVTGNVMGSEIGLLDTDERLFKDVPTSGRLQERQILLPDHLLEPFLSNDIDSLSHAYLKSLAPQVEIMKQFPGDDKNLSGAMQDVRDEYHMMRQRLLVGDDTVGLRALEKKYMQTERDVKAVRDRLYGTYGAAADPSYWLVRAGRMIRSVNVFRLLGTATFSHVPDVANIIMRRGLTRTMATAAKLLSNVEALKLNRDELHRMGGALDMIENTTAAAGGEFGIHSSWAPQQALNRGTRAFTIATLETPWIATCKSLAGAAAHDEILSAAERIGAGRELSANEQIRFNNIGIDHFALQRIADQYKQFGKEVGGLRFGMSEKWHDRGAAQILDTATVSAANASTLHPSVGDTPRWTSSEVGKAVFQFKTFGAVAIRKVLIPLAQGLARGDARAASGLASLIAAGAMTYYAKQYVSNQPTEKNPARLALEVLDKSNLLGWASEYFYPALWAFGAKDFSRWGDRQTVETALGAAIGPVADLWDLRLPAKIYGQMHKGVGDARFTRNDIHRLRRLIPGNQVWYLRRAVNTLERKAGDSLGIAPEAPRKEFGQ